MSIRAVLYDMDGTVLDTLEDLKNAVNAALAAFGRPALTLEQVRAYVGNGSRRLIELALGEGAEIDRMLAWYKPWYDAHCRILTRPYPGVLPLMERLKAAGVRQAIVSNKPDSAVRALAGDFFPGLAECAVGERESEGVRRKPWPDMLNAVRAQMALPPEDCLYVGDSEVDILTAANAGLRCVSVSWGFRSREQLIAAGAQILVDTPEELGALILGVKREALAHQAERFE